MKFNIVPKRSSVQGGIWNRFENMTFFKLHLYFSKIPFLYFPTKSVWV